VFSCPLDFNTTRPEIARIMSKKEQHKPQPTAGSPQKDPEDWTTGDEPMTAAQKSYLKTLSTEAQEEFDENLTKAEASKRIDELQKKTGRGQPKVS